MTLQIRRLLYIFFILIFLILTPLISLYATGYKIGAGFNIQKTGILIINSEPENAKIYVNGKIQQKLIDRLLKKEAGYITTPAKIKNLLPGEYDIKLELTDYWDWQKKLTVKPGESTFAENINLFKKTLPIVTIPGNFQDAALTLWHEYPLIMKGKSLSVFNDTNIIRSFSLPDIQPDTTISFSTKKNKAIIGRNLFTWGKLDRDPLSLDSLIGINSTKIKWGDTEDELYYVTNNSINLFNIPNQTFTTIINSELFSDYLVKDNYVYLVSQNHVSTELTVWDKTKKEIIKKISTPYSNYVFINPEHKYLNLYDVKNKILYIIDPLARFKPLKEVITNVEQNIWINDNKLLFANDFEIWTLDLATSEKNLLTRISKSINKIIPHPSGNYILYATDKDINIIELDDREKYNITKLVEFEKIQDLNLAPDGNTLYFYAKIGNQEGVYKLAIQ